MKTFKKRIALQSLILIITCTFILSCTDIQSQGISFETGNWASVLKQAKSTNKLIFVDVYTTWCGPCKKMDKNVFKNKDVGYFFNKNFISYKLDAEKGEGIALSKKYGVTSYPNLLFVNGNGNLVLRNKGAMDVKQTLEFGAKAMHSEEEVANMTSQYKAGNRAPEFILKYLAFLKERDLPTEEIMINYLEKLDKEQWLSIENLKFIKAYIHTPYNDVIEYLAKRREFVKPIIENYIIDVLEAVYKQYLKRIINDGKGLAEIDEFISHVSLGLKPNEVAYLYFSAKRGIAKRDQDWDSYVKHTVAYVNTYSLDQPETLNNYAWEFYKNDAITDPVALNTALKWINRALQSRTDDYNLLDTKAALLYKLNRKEEALTVANDAVKLAEQNGGDASETLKLIEKIKTK